MEKTLIKLISLIFVFILLFSIPVNAGWWSKAFTVSDDASNAAKLAKSQAKGNVMTNNFKKGIQWEKTAKTSLCDVSGGCITTFNTAQKIIRSSSNLENKLVIYGGKATKQFINENNLYHPGTFKKFTKEPDFLEVTYRNKQITEIKIIDAKTSKAAARVEQEAAFLDLCQYSSVPCHIEYVVPKSSLSKSDSAFLCLATIPLVITGPVGVGVEALCFLATS